MSLNIVCVQAGNYVGRGAEYVNILHDMCVRNLAEGFRGKFTCFTDDQTGLHPAIIARDLPHPGLHGWFNKIALFKPGVFDADDRILYLDLDTLITGRLDEIASYDGEFAILADFFKPTHGPFSGLQSGVMSWRGGFGAHIWEAFEKAGFPAGDGGDQEFIRAVHPHADLWQSMFPGLFVSYKGTGGSVPEKASVCCFHGEPRPHDVTKGWVPKVWKIGGLSRADLDVICNTENNIILGNIDSACKRDLPWFKLRPEHDGRVCIVGGGPSLSDSLDELKTLQEMGNKIWALNGAFGWMADRGLIADAQVLCDARPENAEFVDEPMLGVTHFIASQCHPTVFDMLEGYDVVVYHNLTPGAHEFLQEYPTEKETNLFSGGTTVGMKAMALARNAGFKTMLLYGMDGCYVDGKGHAYEQSLNDDERVLNVVCGDREFKAAAWMISQVNDFQVLAAELMEEGCTICVAGNGLLAHVAREMMRETEIIDDRFKMVGGYLWPKGDLMCLHSVNQNGDIDVAHALAHCSKRKLVLQAGGNVGVYADKLADHFEQVLTIEPDPENFECLVHNLKKGNISALNVALGDENKSVGLETFPRNCGATQVSGPGETKMVTIDNVAETMRLEACDMIWLDVEGYELPALKGAAKTIAKFRPVIRFEEAEHAARLGIEKGAVAEWLNKNFGYVLSARCGRDIVCNPAH